jgi:hypothetical protein
VRAADTLSGTRFVGTGLVQYRQPHCTPTDGSTTGTQPYCHEGNQAVRSRTTALSCLYSARFVDKDLYSRMPLSFMLRLKRCRACDQCHSSRVSTFKPVHTVNCVRTLKAFFLFAGASTGLDALFTARAAAYCRHMMEGYLLGEWEWNESFSNEQARNSGFPVNSHETRSIMSILAYIVCTRANSQRRQATHPGWCKEC